MTQLIRLAGVAALTALLLLGGHTAVAGDIYRWVDDQGVTQIGDSVPAAYKSRAKVIGSTESSVDPDQQKEAQERAAKDAEQLKKLQASKTAASGNSAAQPAVKRTPQPAAAGTDCASLFAAYRASQACFAPYVTVNGLRGGSNCTPVADPSVQCGTPASPQ